MKSISITTRLRKWAIGLAMAITVAMPSQANATLADVPLYLTATVEPNLMFILDDSGSMQWEIMPDSITYTNYLFPRPSGLYDGADYDRRIVVFLDNDIVNTHVRSPHNNRVFYNPEIDYEPWYNADGSQYANSTPTGALHNPALPGVGSVNLTAQQSYDRWRRWVGSWDDENSTVRNFWPITFYMYKGAGGTFSTSSYVKYQIRGTSGFSRDLNGGTEAGVSNFTWPNGITRTVAEETQNFANWYTYYRSRVLAARAGIGKAFALQGETLRVGFGTINKSPSSVDGVSIRSIIRGVRSFSGAEREDFFDRLYGHPMPTSATPLRPALQAAGTYFSRSDNAGPWGNTPGNNADSTSHLACRQSYTILMTDGFWNSTTSLSVGNSDGTSGPLITGPGGLSYQYSPVDPYQDGFSNTLADVAMEYWKKDLRTDLANEVPVSPENPAFWQHMVTFGVGLGVEGAIDPDDAWAAVASGTAVNWGDPSGTASIPEKLDDLLHAGINSRGGYFTASDPDTFADRLSETIASIMERTESSSSSVAANSTRLDAGTLVYQARFDSRDWSGQLLAYQVDSDGELIEPADWDAGQLLPAPDQRKIFTIHDVDDGGVAFDWSSISSNQQAVLNRDALGNTDSNGEQRLAWLRGERTNESPAPLGFRARPSSVLGDIVNSDPVFVGLQDFGNNALPGNEGTLYSTFRNSTAYLNRKKMLYVGANDGMLHGFDAETGEERLAYIPKAVFPELSKLTSPDYTHRFYVNGSPRSADAFIDHDGVGGASWRTVLVGTTGAGGRSVFALDVTDPESFGAGNVLWEFTSDDNAELGYTVGEATIARVKADDKWVALVGNGYNSASLTARLFVLDLETGTQLAVLDTGVGGGAGGSVEPNGLHAPVPVDVDGDRIADFAYAGDRLGNLWKFDLTGDATSNWKVAEPGGAAGPLFSAVDALGAAQPITVRPTVGAHPRGGVMVYFGTGKFLEVGDEIVGLSPQIQSFYGIWDKGAAVARLNLQSQTIEWEGAATFTRPDSTSVSLDMRVVSENQVDYSSKLGWYLDLIDPNLAGTGEGERVISRAILRSGRIIFTSMIPASNPCQPGGEGWLLELDALSGGRLPEAVFDLNEDGYFNEDDWIPDPNDPTGTNKIPPSGIKSQEGIINTPGVIEDGDREYKFASGSSGGIQRIVESSGDAVGRKGWWQLR